MNNSETGNAQLSFFESQISAPPPKDAYLIVVHDLLPAVEALKSHSTDIPSRGCELIAAHVLECTLKALLLHKTKKEEQEKTGLKKALNHHDLKKLWGQAYKNKCLDIPKEPPEWLRILSAGHGPTLALRYQEAIGSTIERRNIVNARETTELISMVEELKDLIEKVKLALAPTT